MVKAKSVLCPLSRPILTTVMDESGGGFKSERIAAACVGGDCAMWRWFDVTDPVEGYCGLAGRAGAL